MRRMTKRRERMRPDTRPHWDDPDLKVVGPDGELYTAEEISEVHQECMQFNRAPTWRRDPSYAWRERAIKFREARAAAIAKQQKIDDSKKLAARKESTEGVERVVLREGIEGTERADHVESTARDERAVCAESTEHRERAASRESTEKGERAKLHESTEKAERAGSAESTEYRERADTAESTVRGERAGSVESTDGQEQGPLALKGTRGPLPPRPPSKNAPKPWKRRKPPPC